MTPGEPSPFLPAPWAARFPRRRHLWAGPVRVWRVETPVEGAHQARVAAWLARAAALGLAALPEHIVESTWVQATAGTPARRTTAYLDLPGGPYPAAVGGPLPSWPGVTAADVPAAFRASVPTLADVPIVRAERLLAVAVDLGAGVEVYADGPLIARLPLEAVVVPGPDDWVRAWRAYAAIHGLSPDAAVAYADGVVHIRRPADAASLTGAWLWVGDAGLRAGAEASGTP